MHRQRQLRWRKRTLSTMLLGVVLGVVLLAVAPPAGAAVTAIFMLLLVTDLIVLVSRAHRAADRAMTAAFRSRPKGGQ